jgi:acyl-coenzyme A thioesterase PaaI-like protein
MDEIALQDRYGADDICFGCGPQNPRGLRIKSRVAGDEVVADWSPGPDVEAFPGILNGGIVATLLDCHSWWTAAHHLMLAEALDQPPSIVTADLAVGYQRPTPSDRPVHLSARITETTDRRTTVDAVLTSDGVTTATATSTFIAVRPGHPAFGTR